MRIAQVAPLYESVPPQLYGGTERVVSWLTEELVRLGHEVTLFASGDWRSGARLGPRGTGGRGRGGCRRARGGCGAPPSAASPCRTTSASWSWSSPTCRAST